MNGPADHLSEVADGVFRLELPVPLDGLTTVNIYLIRGDDGVTFIDSGWASRDACDIVTSAMATLGLTLNDIDRFCITHAHPDHYSLAVAVRSETRAPILLGVEECISLSAAAAGRWPALEPMLARSGEPPASRSQRANTSGSAERPTLGHPDGWIVDGEEFDTAAGRLVALATPGHTRGHRSFLLPSEELIFTGDHVLPVTTPIVGVEGAMDPLALVHYLASLDRMIELDAVRLMPAHGPSGGSVATRAAEIRAHHEQRMETITAIASDAPITAWAIADAMRWTRRGLRLSALQPHHRALAVVEVILHLNALVASGKAVRKEDDGTDVFLASSSVARSVG